MITHDRLVVYCPVHPPPGLWRLVPERWRPASRSYSRRDLASFTFDYATWSISHDVLRAAVFTFNDTALASSRWHVCPARAEIIASHSIDTDYGTVAYSPVARPAEPYRFTENELNYLPRDDA